MLRCQFLCHALKALFFIKIALKLSYFCKKMQNFRGLGAPPPDPQNPPNCEFLATRLLTRHIRYKMENNLRSKMENNYRLALMWQCSINNNIKQRLLCSIGAGPDNRQSSKLLAPDRTIEQSVAPDLLSYPPQKRLFR